MKSKAFFLLMLTAATAWAQQPAIKSISPDLFGIFIEDLNYTADGGLYAEMVQNRSFEYSPHDVDLRVYYNKGQWHPFTAWESLKDGNAISQISLETAKPLNQNNRHYVTLTVHTVGKQGAGLGNMGYEGMVIRKGENYFFSAWLRCEDVERMPVAVSLARVNKRDMLRDSILAEAKFEADSKEWKKYEVVLTANGDLDDAVLDIRFSAKGSISIDMASLFPEKTFKNRKNGLRPDLAQALADLKPAFVRFPGGCLTHGDGLNNIYRWKHTVGPVEQRVEDYNIWDYHQSHGLGFFEYFQLCEDIGAKPLPVLAAGVSCQNSARCRGNGQQAIPMDELDEYVQDLLDLIEWANGDPSTSQWAKMRADAGHPAPFNLEYLGVGNEDHITPEFKERFAIIQRGVKARYPDIKIVGTVGPNPNDWDWREGWNFARQEKPDLVDEHYYRPPQWFLDNLHRYDDYDRDEAKVYVGEYASRGNTVFNAIAEAAYMCNLERNGDIVALSSYAPLLARIGKTQWTPDLIYFDKTDIYPTVNYYVQQLFGQNHGDTYINNVVSGIEGASCIRDSKSGTVIVKLANPSDSTVTISVNLDNANPRTTKATVSTLRGERDQKNGEGRHLDTDIKPIVTTEKLSKKFTRELPPYSFTVIRF
jgi:alpha-L-arabinofuranosidase